MNGYYGKLLDINLTNRKISVVTIPDEDLKRFIGGRGLGMKILTDRITNPGLNPLSPSNVLLFMPGPFSGLPIPNSSRTCIVTKSPRTTPVRPLYKYSSGIAYSNMGGFFGPELRFAGYDGLLVTGKARRPVYIFIEDDRVEIRDASKYWGMTTDRFDVEFIKDLGDRRFESCYIGPAGENLVPMACVINTAARAAGRGGTGCVMGSKNLKAIAVRGTGMPPVADQARLLELIEMSRQAFARPDDSVKRWRSGGTADFLESSSRNGTMAVRNYREGTFEEIREIGTQVNREAVWKRDFACFTCPLACKKSGIAKGAYYTPVHDGPEYETGTMLGSNLLISDNAGMQKCIYDGDDYGIDIISAGNVIGFLMECYEKGLIERKYLDGIDLKWSSVDGTLAMLKKMAYRQGVGDKAARGVKFLARDIGKGSEVFAIHVKGHELAAWNVHKSPNSYGITYTMSNRGACHLAGGSKTAQDNMALRDSLGTCSFASSWFRNDLHYRHFLSAITGLEWTEQEFLEAGERIYNLEKLFNCREGFTSEDDILPERFFTEPFTRGSAAGAVVDRESFAGLVAKYYQDRGWDEQTSRPHPETVARLGLDYYQ
ncbi:MAG: aldehyde ferredoxin oxidoreductase family protein [Bacteroidales bacterium]|jgi:aldehyde:ferredoxin oxidoreductase|nr:aldehyde ferredoxin oxidoreductase family protein [Bacteroidales bacterium]